MVFVFNETVFVFNETAFVFNETVFVFKKTVFVFNDTTTRALQYRNACTTWLLFILVKKGERER